MLEIERFRGVSSIDEGVNDFVLGFESGVRSPGAKAEDIGVRNGVILTFNDSDISMIANTQKTTTVNSENSSGIVAHKFHDTLNSEVRMRKSQVHH